MKKNLLKKIMTYSGTSLLYCIVISAIIYFVAAPTWRKYVPDLSLIIGNTAIQYDDTELKELDINDLSDITGGVLKSSEVHFPRYGEQLGRIVISGEGGESVNAALYFGDGDKQLAAGAGVYIGSTPPGYGSTVLVAGHNHTWFKPLKKVQIGDTVTITTYYGVYTYEIIDIQVKDATDESHYDLLADEENLLLYTCYPFGSIGMTPTRYFIYGKYISGPMVNRGL